MGEDTFLALNTNTGETKCVGHACNYLHAPIAPDINQDIFASLTLQAGITDAIFDKSNMLMEFNKNTGKVSCLSIRNDCQAGWKNLTELHVADAVQLWHGGAFIVYTDPSPSASPAWWHWVLLAVAVVIFLAAAVAACYAKNKWCLFCRRGCSSPQ